jgi:hypothetical protein
MVLGWCYGSLVGAHSGPAEFNASALSPIKVGRGRTPDRGFYDQTPGQVRHPDSGRTEHGYLGQAECVGHVGRLMPADDRQSRAIRPTVWEFSCNRRPTSDSSLLPCKVTRVSRAQITIGPSRRPSLDGVVINHACWARTAAMCSGNGHALYRLHPQLFKDSLVSDPTTP